MKTPRRILVSAGDPSGDLILSKIIHQLKLQWGPGHLEFVGLCGPHCISEGVKPLAASRDVAVVGLFEVMRNLPRILGVMDRMSSELEKCDSLLCVDFPDFNLRLAKKAYARQIPTDYIIAPQVWAWRSERIEQIKTLIRRMYVALPFEESYLVQGGVNARFLGHPLRDLLPPPEREKARKELGLVPNDFAFCVMPGSRRGEIRRHFSLLINAWDLFLRASYRVPWSRNYKIVVPVAPGWKEEDLLQLLSTRARATAEALRRGGVLQFCGDSRRALMACDFGWITSGTATLEAACYALPHILVYKLTRSTAFFVQQMSHYFSQSNASVGLPNILLGRKVVPELLQHEFTSQRLAIETIELMSGPVGYWGLKRELEKVSNLLGELGSTDRIARDLTSLWKGEV